MTKNRHWINITLLISISALSLQVCFADTNFYRYKDKDGHLVITNTLPSEVADQGYEVISPRGNVLETIAPIKSKDELAKDAKEAEQQKQTDLKAENDRKQAALQAKRDEILLKSFTSEEDIVRSRDEKLASIAVLEEITHGNIARLQKQLDDTNTLKTNYKKSGQKVPDSLQKTIEESKRQIQENVAYLERKNAEKANIHTKYQDLIDRFHQLEHSEQTTQNPK